MSDKKDKRGPKPERVKIEGGWPDHKDEKSHSEAD